MDIKAIAEQGVLRPLTDPPDDYTQGWNDAWEVAHSPAQCGHARANWKDPKFGTPEYDGDERCEVCSEVRRLRPAKKGKKK